MNRQSSAVSSMADGDDSWRPVKTKSQNRQSQKLRNGDINRLSSPQSQNNSPAPTEFARNGTTAKYGGGRQQQPPPQQIGRNSTNYTSNSNSKPSYYNSSNSAGGGDSTPYSNHNSNSTSNSFNLQNGYNDPRKAIEKEIKILSKHEANIKHARWMFDEEIKKSEDRLKRAFNEMRERLNQRERALMAELDACKLEGGSLFDAREDFEHRLKMQTARVASMNGDDLEELRQNIRKFMQEKRIEDELGKSLRFQYEPDKLIENINSFGEVQPVHRPARKSPSVLSVVSADGGDVSSVDSNTKPTINRVNIGGVVIQSDSMDPTQLADLTRQLQENLRLQGVAEDILPEVSGSMGSLPQRRRPPPNAAQFAGNGGGGGGFSKDSEKLREKRKRAR